MDFVCRLSRLRQKYSNPGNIRETNDVSAASSSELEQFLDSQLVPHNQDPIEYWLSQDSDAYSTLKDSALRFLLTPASSVASERIVSSVNFILRDSRSSLTSKNVNSIVVLRSYPLEIWSSLVGMNIKSL
jgi:hAT family C-terminal dimerisation region